MNKIHYCQCTYQERMPQTKVCVEQVSPWVDETIIIFDELTEEDKAWLKEKGCRIIQKPWVDFFSDYRNTYIDATPLGDWILVSDPDEIFNDESVKSFYKLVEKAEQIGSNAIEFDNQYEIELNNGEIYISKPNGNYKILLFKKEPNSRYTGLVHETLHGPRIVLKAPVDCFYYHRKKEWEIQERGARNYFCCGSGNNVCGDKWKEFRAWMLNRYNFNKWNDLRDEIRKKINMKKGILKFILNLPNEMDGSESPIHCEIIAFYRWLIQISTPEEIEFYKNFAEKHNLNWNADFR